MSEEEEGGDTDVANSKRTTNGRRHNHDARKMEGKRSGQAVGEEEQATRKDRATAEND